MSGADCGDERSDYELQRARSIRLNKEFLHSQQMVCSGYKISSFTFNSNRSQMSWMKLMLFWLPKSGGVGVMLQNQALIQWYQQLMMLASKAKEELYVERNDGTCWKPASGRKKGLPLTELLGYQKKTLYCSACIAAIWFVIERFGKQIFLCTIFACGSGYETTGKAWHCGSGYETTGKAWHEA